MINFLNQVFLGTTEQSIVTDGKLVSSRFRLKVLLFFCIRVQIDLYYVLLWTWIINEAWCSLTRWLTYSLTCSLTYSLTYSLTCSWQYILGSSRCQNSIDLQFEWKPLVLSLQSSCHNFIPIRFQNDIFRWWRFIIQSSCDQHFWLIMS